MSEKEIWERVLTLAQRKVSYLAIKLFLKIQNFINYRTMKPL